MSLILRKTENVTQASSSWFNLNPVELGEEFPFYVAFAENQEEIEVLVGWDSADLNCHSLLLNCYSPLQNCCLNYLIQSSYASLSSQSFQMFLQPFDSITTKTQRRSLSEEWLYAQKYRNVKEKKKTKTLEVTTKQRNVW